MDGWFPVFRFSQQNQSTECWNPLGDSPNDDIRKEWLQALEAAPVLRAQFRSLEQIAKHHEPKHHEMEQKTHTMIDMDDKYGWSIWVWWMWMMDNGDGERMMI